MSFSASSPLRAASRIRCVSSRRFMKKLYCRSTIQVTIITATPTTW